MYSSEPPVAFLLFILLIAIVMIISLWKIFEKAGKPGWASIVPIYNLIVMVEIAEKEGWWVVLLLFIPLIPQIIIYNEIAKRFGKEGGFTAGMVLLPFVFFPILAFGDAQYKGQSPANAPLDQI